MACKQDKMIKILSHSNLIRGLLLSALIWTIPSNFELETPVQAETVLISSTTKKENNQQDYQVLLAKVNALQEEAKNYRAEVEKFNKELQDKFNSSGKLNKVNLQPLLQKIEGFSQELEKKPNLASINQDIKIAEAELINTIKGIEKTHNSLNNKNFDEIALYKFAFLSTINAADLQLQVTNLEKLIYINLFGVPDDNGFIPNNTEPISGNNGFFSLKGLMVLLALSGCTIFVIRQAYNKNNSVKQIKIKEKNNGINKNYYHNITKPNQSYSQHNNGFSAETNNRQTRSGRTPHYQNPINNQRGITDYSSSSRDLINNKSRRHPTHSRYSPQKSTQLPYEQKTKPYFDLNDESTNNLFPSRKEYKPLPKPESRVSNFSNQTNTIDEKLKEIYQHNPKDLLKKVIKVAATRESIERRRSGFETPITFTETSNDSYWIILEPKSEHGYYLVPKPNLVINSRIYQTIEDIFNCQGYDNRTSNKFKLGLFATVQSEGSGSWKLVEPGELLFS